MRMVTESQGDQAWHEARCGLATASRMSEVMNYLKRTKKDEPKRESAERRNLRIELMTERFTGEANPHYVSPDMELGVELEPYAISAYEREKRVMAMKVGFVLHPTLDITGASPDGLIGIDGAVECKCPRATTHMRWNEQARAQRAAGIPETVPAEHQEQCLWVMECCDREWIDFVSYCPKLPKGLDLLILRMFRDEVRLELMREEILRFEGEINDSMEYWKKFIKTPEPSLSDADFEAAYSNAPMPDDMSGWAAAFDYFIQGDVTP